MEEIWLHVEDEDAEERIDKYLAGQFPDRSRSYLQKLISEGLVLRNGQAVRSRDRIMGGDEIAVRIPEAQPLHIPAEDIPLDILYEDSDVLVINKPKNMVVHPAAGHYTGTVVNAVLYHCRGNLSGINGILRPGIVHRIDRDTTGAIVICKNDAAHRCLAAQLKEHSITRRYRAIVAGNLREDEGTIDRPIGRHPTDRKKMAVVTPPRGKAAVTHYRVLERFGEATLIECRLETGRTHQIRVHMASVGHPLLGDTVYGSVKNPYHLEGQCLHAMVLGFLHPTTGKYVEFEAPLPAYFTELLRKLSQKSAGR